MRNSNSISLASPKFGIVALLIAFLIAACTRPAPTPQPIEPPGPTQSLYPPPPLVGTPPTFDLNFMLTAYPAPATAIPTGTPTFGPSPIPSSTPTPFPTYPPPPTLLPTLDPTTLPDKLRAALTLQTEAGLNFHGVRRVTGWEYGFRSSGYCADGPYRWLDDSHLLLYPTTGQEEGMGISEFALPVVMDLNNGSTWLPPTNGPTPGCDAPLWSEALQTLIATTAQEVTLLKPDGTVAQRFVGGVPLYYSSHLSPSGKRLVTGAVWRDLETGQTVDFSSQNGIFAGPGWSSDEKHLSNCCFSYADVDSERFTVLNFDQLELPGRDGPGPDAPRWVLDDTRVMIEFDLYESGRGAVPLIDPKAQTYEDVRILAGLGANASCGAPHVAPNGEHILVGCFAPSGSLNLLSSQMQLGTSLIKELFGGPALGPLYLIDLRTLVTHTIPAGLNFVSWSPDSQFALLLRGSIDWQTQRGEYFLLPATGDDLYPYPVGGSAIIAPAWSPNGQYLAYLSEDGKALITLEPATRASYIVLLPQPSTNAFWSPHGDSLAVLAADGGLWWVPNPAYDHIEQITLPIPNVRDVRWAPSGHTLAFVSGSEVFVVAAAIAGP